MGNGMDFKGYILWLVLIGMLCVGITAGLSIYCYNTFFNKPNTEVIDEDDDDGCDANCNCDDCCDDDDDYEDDDDDDYYD